MLRGLLGRLRAIAGSQSDTFSILLPDHCPIRILLQATRERRRYFFVTVIRPSAYIFSFLRVRLSESHQSRDRPSTYARFVLPRTNKSFLLGRQSQS
jgi:hypothetical protein